MRNGNVLRSRDFWAESPNMFQSRPRGSHDIRLTRSQQGAIAHNLMMALHSRDEKRDRVLESFAPKPIQKYVL